MVGFPLDTSITAHAWADVLQNNGDYKDAANEALSVYCTKRVENFRHFINMNPDTNQ